MLNYLNQGKNEKKNQHTYFQEETDFCIPLTIKFFPKGDALTTKNMNMLHSSFWSQENKCCSCLDFTRDKLAITKQNREGYLLIAQCVGTKRTNKQTKNPGTTGLLGISAKVLEKTPQPFALEKKDFFVHCRHWCIIFIADPLV